MDHDGDADQLLTDAVVEVEAESLALVVADVDLVAGEAAEALLAAAELVERRLQRRLRALAFGDVDRGPENRRRAFELGRDRGELDPARLAALRPDAVVEARGKLLAALASHPAFAGERAIVRMQNVPERHREMLGFGVAHHRDRRGIHVAEACPLEHEERRRDGLGDHAKLRFALGEPRVDGDALGDVAADAAHAGERAVGGEDPRAERFDPAWPPRRDAMDADDARRLAGRHAREPLLERRVGGTGDDALRDQAADQLVA